MNNDNKILVTSPLLLDLQEFYQYSQQIWDSKWITNNGSFHKQLEKALAEYLNVPYISLFTNGTLLLISTLQVFDPYKDYPSAAPENLPVATKIADQVICLPMHHALSEEDVERVVTCIVK